MVSTESFYFWSCSCTSMGALIEHVDHFYVCMKYICMNWYILILTVKNMFFLNTIYKVAIIYFPVLEILKSFRIGDGHRSAQYQHENMGDDRNVSSSDYGNDKIG